MAQPGKQLPKHKLVPCAGCIASLCLHSLVQELKGSFKLLLLVKDTPCTSGDCFKIVGMPRDGNRRQQAPREGEPPSVPESSKRTLQSHQAAHDTQKWMAVSPAGCASNIMLCIHSLEPA